jgi:tetratricopeptide (TPR) repeat protein
MHLNNPNMKPFLALVLLLPFFAFSQTAITSEQRQNANTYFQAANWKESIKAYHIIAQAEPQNWNAKMRLGISMTKSGQTKDAISVLQESIKVGNNGQTNYYLSSAYAKDGDKEKAFAWLDSALVNGFAFLTVFESDEGFSALKTDARYQLYHDRILRGIYPCRYSSEARQFDFWIGEWDIKNTQGQPAGKSKIELMLGDCILLENWTSALPNLYAGKSINLYNSATKKWMQTWVDDKGALIEFIEGEYKDNTLTFITKPDAQHQITKLTFYHLSTDLVRQHFEVSTDAGKNWTTTTDLYYHRTK